MKFNKKLAAGVAGITMAGAAFAAGPAFAQTDEGTDDTTEESSRPTVGDGLQELVDNGTITQEQLDSIIEQFEARRAEGDGVRGPRGFRGAASEAVQELLGMEQDELREALQSGQTLAEVAEANGVSTDVLVDTIVSDANERLDEKVAEGVITAEEADEKRENLEERAIARVNGERPERPEGFDGPGPRGDRGPRAGEEVTPDA